MGTLLSPEVCAATYSIRFYDDAIKTESQNTTVVQGYPINIRATLPPLYKFVKATPFAVADKGGTIADPSSLFSIREDNTQGTLYTLTAKPASIQTGDTAEYTLNAIYTAIVSEASGIATYSKVGEQSQQYSLRVVSTPPISIIEDSTLMFTALEDQTDTNMVLFSTATAVGNKGFFVDFDGQPIEAGVIAKDSGGMYIPMSITSKNASSPQRLDFKVYMQGVSSTHKIKKDTTFKITFLRQMINSMILSVITPKKAADDTVASVLSNPTNPEATVKGVPYLSLKKGETLNGIKSNFNALSVVHRHNADITLNWEWDAKEDAHQKNVKINAGKDVTAFDIINRPKEDMPGELVVTATCGTVTSVEGRIPILIYGTGTPPTVIPLTKQTGNPGQTPNPLQEALTALPGTMDVYQGDANTAVYPDKPLGPFSARFSVDFGNGRGIAETLKITNLGGGGELELRVDGSPVPYVWGTELKNPGSSISFEATASKLGQVNLRFEFYNSNKEPMTVDWVNWKPYLHDSRPQTDGRLEALGLQAFTADAPNGPDQKILEQIYPSPKGQIDYGFNPDTNTYNVAVPNKVTKVQVKPRLRPGTGARKIINVTYDGRTEAVDDGDLSSDILLETQKPKNIAMEVMAQDGSLNTYTLRVTRLSPSTDSSAKSITARAPSPSNAPDLLPGFNPKVFLYEFSVPYAMDKIKITGITSSAWAKGLLTPPGGSLSYPTNGEFSEIIDLDITYDPDTGIASNNVTSITFEVASEANTTTNPNASLYTLKITRLPPSDNRRLSALSVQDENGAEIPFAGKQKFSPGTLDYSITIPYSSKTLDIIAKPEDSLATKVTLTHPDGATDEKNYNGSPITFRRINVEQDPVHNPDKDLLVFKIAATAESTRLTDPPYSIEVVRAPPDTDNTLSALGVTDENNAAVPDYAFRTHTFEYDIVVPYLSRSVNITPVTTSKLATAEVDGKRVTTKFPSVNVKLDPGVRKDVSVVVTAESGDKLTYVLRITRSKPSNEARLANLQVGGLTLKPTFVPSKTEYEVTMPKEMQNFTVTPTAIDPNATITVGGKTIASGATTSPITPDAAETYTEILVTAQDGITKRLYKVKVLAEGLFPSSNNADLKDLQVKEGSMTPKFKPAIYNYELAVKRDTSFVDILPVLAEPHATLEVSIGSKKIGDYNSNYSTALTSDKTDIKVTVQSQDKTVKNEYTVTVYRNDEEKEGIYKPITSDMVDYETNDPIIVDVSVYTIVAADVFNKLKTDYPEKTMIIKGNDYAFEFKGTDIKQLVPNTELFDFALSFTTPEEPKVRSWLDRNGNGGLQPVYVYFTHHGPLPASMKFTLSLGGAYKNRTLYWNYYNTERDRVDFYGTVRANTKGTFTVPMSHMSTYLVTTTYINGAEDKSGLEGGVNGNLSNAMTSGKRNPSTAAGKDDAP